MSCCPVLWYRLYAHPDSYLSSADLYRIIKTVGFQFKSTVRLKIKKPSAPVMFMAITTVMRGD